MSTFMSDKFLKYRSLGARPTVVIEEDAKCRACGYNLRGLRTGTRCPECGAAMDEALLNATRYGKMLPRINVYLPDDPRARSRLRAAFGVAALSLVVIGVLRLAFVTPNATVNMGAYDIALLAASLAWAISIFILTPRAYDKYGPTMRTARLAARWLNFGWPIAFSGAVLMDYGSAGAFPTAMALFALGQVAGAIGTLLFFAILSPAAWDADRDDVGKRAMTAFWGLLFTSWIVMLSPRGIAPVGMFWVLWGLLYWMALLWLFPLYFAVWCLMTMYQTVGWPSRRAHVSATRDERIRSTRSEVEREAMAKIRPYPKD